MADERQTERMTRTGYMDLTAFQEELGEVQEGVRVYPTPADVSEHEKCSSECGICKVTITLDYVV